ICPRMQHSWRRPRGLRLYWRPLRSRCSSRAGRWHARRMARPEESSDTGPHAADHRDAEQTKDSVGKGASMRIVSLLPSATAIVCALGLRDQLVGVTHECDYPADVAALPKVTRTLIPKDASSGEIDQMVRERLKDSRALYSLDMDVLARLNPDVIVTQALCNVCAVAEEEVCAAAEVLPGKPTVINLEPQTLREVIATVRSVGRSLGVEATGDRVADGLERRVSL